MKSYMLFGFENTGIEFAKDAVGRRLGISFVVHESGFTGAYYRCGLAGAENFILQDNFDSEEQEYAEPEFKEYSVILYVSETSRSVELIEALSGLARALRTEEL